MIANVVQGARIIKFIRDRLDVPFNFWYRNVHIILLGQIRERLFCSGHSSHVLLDVAISAETQCRTHVRMRLSAEDSRTQRGCSVRLLSRP
jgi:hypothetical protein